MNTKNQAAPAQHHRAAQKQQHHRKNGLAGQHRRQRIPQGLVSLQGVQAQFTVEIAVRSAGDEQQKHPGKPGQQIREQVAGVAAVRTARLGRWFSGRLGRRRFLLVTHQRRVQVILVLQHDFKPGAFNHEESLAVIPLPFQQRPPLGKFGTEIVRNGI